MYVSLSLDEARLIDPAAIRDKCIRIRLQPGEIYDLELDCLQLTLQQLGEAGEAETVTLGDFDMAALFTQAFDQAGVAADLRPTLLARYDELKASPC
jgi:hypothetical protein